MCATFQLSFDDISEIKSIADEITREYGSDAADHCFNTDFYPKNEVPVIGEGNKISLLKWGFPLKDSSKVIFNARAESFTEKSMFKTSLSNRCLVSATVFYEWDREKKKYSISVENKKIFYMAALWKGILDTSGNKAFYFTIITTEPHSQIKQIHNRMPAIIAPENYQSWLNGTDDLELLKPFEEMMLIRSA